MKGKNGEEEDESPPLSELIHENGVKIYKNKKVFYNPAQKFNRDLSIEVIREYISDRDDPKLFEAMSATGLRGIRYFKELEKEVQVHLNDWNSESTKSIKENILLNGLNPDDFKISNEDCNAFMANHPNYFDVIDIDPFGSCTTYVDNALTSLKNGGLLCLTSTDLGVLCNNKAKCYLKYSTAICKTPACHELALRTVLSFVSRQASKFNIAIVPVLSISVDFYVRLFVKIRKRLSKARCVIESNSYRYLCTCFNMKKIDILNKAERYENVKVPANGTCEICGLQFRICGPFWNECLYDVDFIRRMMNRPDRILDNRLLGLLRLMVGEIDTFLYYNVPALCSKLGVGCIPLLPLFSALLKLNYRVSLTHCRQNSLKTDAPLEVLNEVIKRYFKPADGHLKISFEEEKAVRDILERKYYRGLSHSRMGPLSRP
jgi:tRNA (guanine26-N2/guanine27-N2)-dimethyltransferase